MNPDPSHERDLLDVFSVLRRRKWIVLLGLAIGIGGALMLAYLTTPRYASSVQLLLRDSAATDFFEPSGVPRSDPDRQVQNEVSFIESQRVQDEATTRLGFDTRIDARSSSNADVIILRATATEPVVAATIADTYAQVFLDLRKEALLADFTDTAEILQREIDDMSQQAADLDTRIAALTPFIGEGEDPQTNPAYAELSAEKENLQSDKALLQQQLRNIEVNADVFQGNSPQVITDAKPAADAYTPRVKRSLVMGTVVGILLGVALAFAVDYADDSIKGKDDLLAATSGTTMLALVPRVSGWKNQDDAILTSLTEPTSPTAEAYRSLRTAIQFKGIEKPITTVLVTSPRSGDGKTTAAANLAVALARAHQRVVVVSCDLRRPRLHQFFGLSNTVGFTSVLVGDAPLDQALQAVPAADGLVVLPSGPIPPNPSELLSTSTTREVFRRLAETADIVVIDSPPILPVTDALVLSEFVDAVVLVVTARQTTRKQAHRSHELLTEVGAPLIGTVLNGVTGGDDYGYGYGYESPSRPAKTPQIA